MDHQGDTVDKRLYKAIQEDNWVKAREIVNTGEIAWTTNLDDTNNTALHFVVGRYANIEAAKEILKGLDPKLFETIKETTEGLNPAHTAALFGNTKALKIMLDSNPKCLFIPDNDGDLVIHLALRIPALKETIPHLFKQMKSYKDEYDIFLRGRKGLELLRLVIETGLIDVAYELINDYPSMATPVNEEATPVNREATPVNEEATPVNKEAETPLEWIIGNLDLFYSRTHYNSFQRFVYHHVPIEDNSLGNTDTADVENQGTPNNDKFVTKHTRSCLHDVISRICFKLLETTLLHVPHVKHLKDDKVKHNTTIKLLRRICEEADRRNKSSDIERLYSSPFCLAVENNNADAIDVLTTYFPQLYKSTKDRHNVYQLTVLNRSEKVYNYILNHGPYPKSVLKFVKGDGDNNVLHLVGRLAPIHKLNVASGAALQMQRELQWFEEVKKVVGITQTRELNKDKETPLMVFRREHRDLRKDGEEWMKKTSDSYTITAALIITIVFAAAITVPGGNDSATGKPIYETKASLIIFAISDAISLFTSTTSLLLFLSILTARYADEDFLYKLPKRLIFGLVMLFVSVTSMMIALLGNLHVLLATENNNKNVINRIQNSRQARTEK